MVTADAACTIEERRRRRCHVKEAFDTRDCDRNFFPPYAIRLCVRPRPLSIVMKPITYGWLVTPREDYGDDHLSL